MILRHFYHRELAQASYLVGCAATGEALIVDPNRDIEQYIHEAEIEELTITAIAETHIHADYVSGSRELAKRTGATVYLSKAGTEDWQYEFTNEIGARLVEDGDSFMLGNIRFDVMHTPGHTPEHVCFVVTDTVGADQPMGVFTGDFVFVGDVGRPDLLEKAAGYADTMEAGARDLFTSIQRFKELPEWLQIWPGHGAGSACGRSLGAVPQTTIGYESLFNWAFQVESQEEFVDTVLDGQPEPPVYFAEMKRVNKVGPTLLSKLSSPQKLSAPKLLAGLGEGRPIVDTRPAEKFAEEHLTGTINIPLEGNFITWAGWLLPYDRPFGMIVDTEHVDSAVARLRMIGLDNLAGYWPTSVLSSDELKHAERERIEQIDIERLRSERDRDPVTVVDVRGASEYESGHIPGSINIPLGYLADRMDEIPSDGPLVVNCQTGRRSAIAASILSSRGRGDVQNLEGGFHAWESSGKPVEHEAKDRAAASR